MLSADLMELLDFVGREMRPNCSHLPFGGVQLVMCVCPFFLFSIPLPMTWTLKPRHWTQGPGPETLNHEFLAGAGTFASFRP